MKITDYSELAEVPNDNDFLMVVDVSDTSMATTGTTKKVKKSYLGSVVDQLTDLDTTVTGPELDSMKLVTDNLDGTEITAVVNDLTPQLGGALDLNGNNITSGATTITPTEMTYLDGVTSGIQTQIDTKAPLTGTIGFVNHGATAGTSRPSGYGVIFWYGSVAPTNAVNGDIWCDVT